MKKLLILTPMLLATIVYGHSDIYFKSNSEGALNKVYENILVKNISKDCLDLSILYSHRAEILQDKLLIGLDVSIEQKTYNFGPARDIEIDTVKNEAIIFAYDSGYANSAPILKTLKAKNVIDEKLEEKIETTLSFQPHYKFVIDIKTNMIKNIYTGLQYGNSFKKICGE
jgi:hypothetical protein